VARTPVDAMITTLSTTRARSKHKQKRKISKRMVARASWDPPESFVSELDGSTCLAQFIGPPVSSNLALRRTLPDKPAERRSRCDYLHLRIYAGM
jgi:hypothetical protein